jgi:hypothetical protein
MASGRKPTTGSKWGIGDPLWSDLLDFAEAHRGSPINRLIEDALRAFIDDRLKAEPELRKRFDAAREERLGAKAKVTPLRSVKDC